SEGPLVSDILKYALITSEHAIDYQDISSNLRFYDKALSDQVEREAHILVELTQYVAEEKSEQLYLQYQPIVGVHCNTIVGFEALARFTSSTYGVVPPNEFIAIAEKYKLIIPLGWKITAQALAFGKALSTRGFDDLKISINFSVYQLLEDQFVSTLDALVEEHDLDPSRLILEITETGVNTTYRRVNLILGELQTLGFTVAIDDFGVGYSTFARESELNVDYLKIDKLFVDRLLTPSEYESVIPDMISMVHKLGHTVIVEGVEHEEQKRYLEEFGCDLYQGFLFSKPLDCTVALGLLSSA
ncbi:MAG: EAL domain-containing protein, partial [Sphaerochaeta sp.]